MFTAKVAVSYLSAGANRQTGVADWNQDGTLAFGADANICLWRPTDSQDRGVTALLSGHSDTVKAVKFLSYSPADSVSYLVSGSDDKSLKLWAVNSEEGSYSCVQTAQEHTAAINCIATLPQTQDTASRCLFVSGAADATVKIWELSSGKINLLQTIKTAPKFFPLAVALHPLGRSQDSYVLAVAGTRDIIQIFATEPATPTPEFTLQATLTGHEGWIRSLDFCHETTAPTSDILLASASQDKYIRLWRLHQGSSLPSAPAAGADPSLGAYLPGKSPSNKAHRFKSGGEDYSVTFEALLLGHEDWIYTAKWHRSSSSSKLELLSASADNSLSVWEADPTSGIWITSARLGEISREKGATTATGSIGGFWTGLWAPDGSSVVTLGRTGSWRRWDRRDDDDWVPGLAVSGHTRAVTGLAWARDGGYLLSTSSDQTTRQHAEWIFNENGKRETTTWHEMSRPQIHGYDLNCIDTLPNNSFVSGADEKLMRVFSAPKAVVRLVSRLTGRDTSEAALDALPAEAADIPVLGLSNKAVMDGDDAETADQAAAADTDNPKATSQLDAHPTRPPLEDLLSRATLWPETEKLYGHGYELSCLAASHSGRLIASACRASSVNHAVVRVFETGRWTELRPPLAGHTLTATRIRFAPDDGMLLSVGRDRQWVVWRRGREEEGEGEGGYSLFQNDAKGHSRMILDAAWAPILGETRVFATAGRDKQVKVWVGRGEGKFSLGKAVAFEGPVTAIDFLGRAGRDGCLVLAVGTEGGEVAVVRLRVGEEGVDVLSTEVVKDELCLPKAVLQLAWRPVLEEGVGDGSYDLAVAGEDSSLRIYKIQGL
ncbi:WD domain-containing protein [Coniochaeta ligniaria NRRL 30616]|uniref:Elongator complex protein 2 n=1 Tax=Coniochaeta ligniaria NRRL 30616 TaxID=1408157 RepID=A0A1J7IPJ2_9PEZI|nr:WD domain-containing protein [Coniochaeta ligniaria NRRL 30616]